MNFENILSELNMESEDKEEYSSGYITERDLFIQWLKNISRLNFTNNSEDTNETLIERFRKYISSSDYLSKYPELSREKILKNVLIILFYSLIIIVSLFGNLLVCKVILSRRSLRRRTTNILILNLSFSDLLMTVFAIPVTVTRLILDDWPFGTSLCVMAPLIQV